MKEHNVRVETRPTGIRQPGPSDWDLTALEVISGEQPPQVTDDHNTLAGGATAPDTVDELLADDPFAPSDQEVVLAPSDLGPDTRRVVEGYRTFLETGRVPSQTSGPQEDEIASDTSMARPYAYVHPVEAREMSADEAARVLVPQLRAGLIDPPTGPLDRLGDHEPSFEEVAAQREGVPTDEELVIRGQAALAEEYARIEQLREHRYSDPTARQEYHDAQYVDPLVMEGRRALATIYANSGIKVEPQHTSETAATAPVETVAVQDVTPSAPEIVPTEESVQGTPVEAATIARSGLMRHVRAKGGWRGVVRRLREASKDPYSRVHTIKTAGAFAAYATVILGTLSYATHAVEDSGKITSPLPGIDHPAPQLKGTPELQTPEVPTPSATPEPSMTPAPDRFSGVIEIPGFTTDTAKLTPHKRYPGSGEGTADTVLTDMGEATPAAIAEVGNDILNSPYIREANRGKLPKGPLSLTVVKNKDGSFAVTTGPAPQPAA